MPYQRIPTLKSFHALPGINQHARSNLYNPFSAPRSLVHLVSVAVLLLRCNVRTPRGLLKVSRDIRRPDTAIMHVIVIKMSFLLVRLPCLAGFPVGVHFFNLLPIVKLGIVVFAYTTESLPQRQVLWVDGDTVVIGFATCSDVLPPAFLFLEIQTGGVWEEK